MTTAVRGFQIMAAVKTIHLIIVGYCLSCGTVIEKSRISSILKCRILFFPFLIVLSIATILF